MKIRSTVVEVQQNDQNETELETYPARISAGAPNIPTGEL
jgi:hypothetical protein